jgi:hypothetical protein
MQINCGAGQTTNNLNRKQIRSYSRFPFQACLLRLFFSKLLQELPLVALVQHKKINLSCTRLSITIAAKACQEENQL